MIHQVVKHLMKKHWVADRKIFWDWVLIRRKALQDESEKSTTALKESQLSIGSSVITLWLCQNSYWKWPFIVDFPIKNGDFP